MKERWIRWTGQSKDAMTKEGEIENDEKKIRNKKIDGAIRAEGLTLKKKKMR